MGSELCRRLGSRALPLGRADLDLADLNTLAERVVALRPAAVINAAAFTQVDRAEADRVACRTVNALAVQRIAIACERLRCPLVQVSTDYVFGADLKRATPYGEDDSPGPLSVYGHAKWQGEHAAAHASRHLIVRTSGLYARPTDGIQPTNFVTTMLRLGRTRPCMRVVNDQWCTPSYVPHVADAILSLLAMGAEGVWHVVNGGHTHWCDFAQEIFRQAKLPCGVTPISTSDYLAAAKRPHYSVLSTEKLDQAAGRSLPDWPAALAEYFSTSQGSDRLAEL